MRLKRTLARERPDLAGEIEVVSNPEFLREGKAVEDSLRPERILVGAETEWAFDVVRRIYKPLTDDGVPLIETNIQTAELSKHASNAFLALKISFANALAVMCEKAGADVVDVAQVMGLDSRIGPAFLNAGLGYGGYCFPKDLQAFERLANKLGYDFALLKEVERINDLAVDLAVQKVVDALWNLEDKKVVLLGLAFKPETDDVRFAPALVVARKLLAEGARVIGWDPGGRRRSQGRSAGSGGCLGCLRCPRGRPLRRGVYGVGPRAVARPRAGQASHGVSRRDRWPQRVRARTHGGAGVHLLPDRTSQRCLELWLPVGPGSSAPISANAC